MEKKQVYFLAHKTEKSNLTYAFTGCVKDTKTVSEKKAFFFFLEFGDVKKLPWLNNLFYCIQNLSIYSSFYPFSTYLLLYLYSLYFPTHFFLFFHRQQCERKWLHE